ncbi:MULTISPECIES: SDR family oxidoreductase [Methylomonas]|uniref:NAD(P)-dependent oxidoreductase n=2 Tax=Methylomonas TaxID=416 RepID=A0A126T685_9GAMM|nr:MULTISPECIES: SDR family oxidoreductase [Methylomonas]AMK77585.1 NAD(P)-dependent oxidoreductase [Methylomonas denitrificans]OAI05164.1 NAD(P)-dependent oxidoreductase [Methylomonas methanica]TCV84371.1 nucleoside-diphosphate-sugar epimerase [Methylomonas methanica]
MANILVIGCGDIGYQVALRLHQQGHQVTGLKRSALSISTPFPIFIADIRSASSLVSLPSNFDAVVFIVAPDSRQAGDYEALYDVGLSNLLEHFAATEKSPSWLMVSSTSVYEQNRGEWVDEASMTEPASATSRWLVAAEKRLWAASDRNCVVRFSGIYGPGRDWLLRRAAQGESIQQEPPSYTNRIHSEDCVAILLFLMEKQLAGLALEPCYLATDDEPASLWDVMSWLSEQFAYPHPSALPVAPDAPQNKRCRNAKLKALGYRLLYPSYRDGYGAMRPLSAAEG